VNERAERTISIFKACTFVVVAAESAVVAFTRDRLSGGIMFFTCALMLSNAGNYAYGFPLIDDEREVQGLMLGGKSETEARAEVSRGAILANQGLCLMLVVFMTVATALFLWWHGSTAALLNWMLARGSVVLLVAMIPLVLLPYVVIALMFRRKRVS
jgi:hypothetical protein